MRKKVQPQPAQCYIDSPESDALVSSPQFELRGWLALDPELTIDGLDIIDATGKRLPLHICRREDAEAARPNHRVLGLNQLLPTKPFISGSSLSASIVVVADGDELAFPIERPCEPTCVSTDGYYHSDDHLSDAGRALKALTEAQKAHWREFGYLVLSGFFPHDRITEFNTYVDDLWATRKGSTHGVTIDAFAETARHQRLYFKNAPDAARAEPYKINDLFVTESVVRDLILEPRLAELLDDLLDGPPLASNTLYMEYGSQQADHFDTFYMPPLVRNKMLATWIALDDVDDDNGPLRYYPGSHLIEPYVFSNGRYNETTEELGECMSYVDKELKARGIEPVRFHAKRGDVFIWHAHLLHGGMKIRDADKTRRSLVTHYFRTKEFEPDQVLPHGETGYYMNRPPAPVAVPSNRRNDYANTLRKA